jgi:hypothetical protein
MRCAAQWRFSVRITEKKSARPAALAHKEWL